MRTTVLNRDFEHPADGWYQIEAPGEHPNAQAGVVQVIDGPAVDSIVNRFNQEAADYSRLNGRPFPGLLIDHEHFKHDADKESVAYGWLMRMENRNGIPFGEIKWTATGKPAVDGADYRFFSTEYAPKDLQVLNPGQTPPRVRPLRLDGLTLTNDPNNKGCAPITNRTVPGFGSYETQEAWEAARQENLRHVQANKDASAAVEEQRRMDAEGEAAALALPALEKFCRAVKSVLDSSSKTGRAMMTFPVAWSYAQSRFPYLYSAAFELPDLLSEKPESTSKLVSALSNRIGELAGRNFDFGFQFVQSELPRFFNRMTLPVSRIENRDRLDLPNFETSHASKIFNRLVRAKAILSNIPDHQAWQMVANDHPGLYALAEDTASPSQAVAMEHGLGKLLK